MSFNLNICVVCFSECGSDGVIVKCSKLTEGKEEIEEHLGERQKILFIKRETKNYIKYSSNWTELHDGTRICPVTKTYKNGDIQEGFLMVGGERLTVYLYDFFELKEECEELGIPIDLEEIYCKTYKSEKRLLAAGWIPS